MTMELYQFLPSPPCRMVRMLCKQLGVDVDMKDLDMGKGEHLQPEFVEKFYFVSKINPQHTIPTLVDDGLIITESRAILMYLVNKYGEGNESLYPNDPVQRAKIDMRICFDLSTLYVTFSETYYPVIFSKQTLNPANVARVNTALGYVEMFLNDVDFIAGNDLTIADFSLSVILSTLEAVQHDFGNYPNIQGYLERCAETIEGWEEINMKGLETFGGWFKAAMAELEG